MRVAVIALIDTDGYGKPEFEKEVITLVKEVDPEAKVVNFDMFEVAKETTLSDLNLDDFKTD